MVALLRQSSRHTAARARRLHTRSRKILQKRTQRPQAHLASPHVERSRKLQHKTRQIRARNNNISNGRLVRVDKPRLGQTIIREFKISH